LDAPSISFVAFRATLLLALAAGFSFLPEKPWAKGGEGKEIPTALRLWP